MALLNLISSVKWFKPLSGGFPPPASLVFMVALVFRALDLVPGIVLGVAILGIDIGLLIYVPAIVLDSFGFPGCQWQPLSRIPENQN